ncbi:hypothetical protein SDC9_75761 [bioreactor metagenome]|jgi:hypothetical protein|uniref:DUF306 domain-containing protein n=1 Tax=bioreactor metagenome TaxID=1076179 RepID=A0A644YMV9_9ZZZZ|nr:META domain-containing protein [Paludibacter sp.]
MKRKTFLFAAISLFLLTAGAGCEKEKEEYGSTELYGTWKLTGFSNTAGNTLREAEPKDCEKCYTMTFLKDGTITGHTSTNEIEGECRIKGGNLNFLRLGGTEINELFDGQDYVEALYKVDRFEIISKQLKLYYGDTDYLLFKKK